MEKRKRFRKFLSRMNRGVALGLAIVIITITYGAVSCSNFEKKELPRIEALLKSYLEESFMIAEPMKDAKVGKAIPDDIQSKLMSRADELVKKYYSTSDAASMAYNRGAIGATDLLLNVKEGMMRMNAYRIKSVTYVEPKNEYAMEARGELLAGKYSEVFIDISFILEVESDNMVEFLGFANVVSGKQNGISERKLEINVNGLVTLIREDGEWRIASMNELYINLVRVISEKPIKEVA